VVPAPQQVLPVPPLDSLAQLNYDYQPPSALKQPPVVNFMDQQFSSYRWVGYLNAMLPKEVTFKLDGDMYYASPMNQLAHIIKFQPELFDLLRAFGRPTTTCTEQLEWMSLPGIFSIIYLIS